MKPFEGEAKSEFEKIMESYANFMMSKIIANTKDLVGLVLYNVVNMLVYTYREVRITHSILTISMLCRSWRSPQPRRSRMLPMCTKIILRVMG